MEPDNVGNEVEHIAPGVTRSWLDEKRIVVFTASTNQRASVDAWYNVVLKTVTDWPADQPYLELQDMRTISITPYNQQRALALTRAIAHKPGRSAILTGSSFLGQVMRAFINNLLRFPEQHIDRRAFTSLDEALAWLRAGKKA